MISTVDPDAWHGHKTAAHGFDGHKGQVAISEVIVATTVSAGNAAAAAAVAELLDGELPVPETAETAVTMMIGDGPLVVDGDSAYGTGAPLQEFERSGVEAYRKTQPPRAPGGRFPKSEFTVDLDGGTVSCPAGHTVAVRSIKGGQLARFGGLAPRAPSPSAAPAAGPGARSISASTSASALPLAPARPTGHGRPTTPRPARPWSARSLT